jgi:hypothetical protein
MMVVAIMDDGFEASILTQAAVSDIGWDVRRGPRGFPYWESPKEVTPPGLLVGRVVPDEPLGKTAHPAGPA